MTWMQVLNGKPFELLAPTAEQVRLGEIAHALAGLNRFCGHSNPYISVAEHSIRVARILEETGHRDDPTILLYGLLHDAHEAYTGDMTRPLQLALQVECPGFKQAWARIQHDIQCCIHEAAGLPGKVDLAISDIVHRADLQALTTSAVSC